MCLNNSENQEAEMSALPEKVKKAWEQKNGAVTFTTVNKQGVPNSVYVTCINKFGDDTILIADNYFDKTRRNIFAGSKASVLFITNDGKSFQIKGSIEYHKEGAMFDDMKKWNPKEHPGHAVVAIKLEEIYSGAEKIL
jgi:predicted pyridoxine 5'-phosphate oxidase superfamily flavin-nucleotide-binding protein